MNDLNETETPHILLCKTTTRRDAPTAFQIRTKVVSLACLKLTAIWKFS